jgi:hypothetical protein
MGQTLIVLNRGGAGKTRVTRFSSHQARLASPTCDLDTQQKERKFLSFMRS